MRSLMTVLTSLTLVLAIAPLGTHAEDATPVVRVSPRDARYFELSDGSPFIPIGLNLAALGNVDEATGLAQMEHWISSLAAHGGNHARVWLSSPFWDIEHARCGQYDPAKARRIDQLLAMAKKHGIRLKLTLEHFREIDPDSGYQKSWALKSLHHVSRGGTATSMDDWFDGAASRRQFEEKLTWMADRYGDDRFVFGWELWNEVNATRSARYFDWTEHMLAELDRRFPCHLVMQSLGSFDRDGARSAYQRLSRMHGNDLAQVHRYLDLGAELEVCHGPVDVLAADAVGELLAMAPGRPVLLAESGAVEPNHTGPFALYEKDTHGMILHDVVFAPFFAGAAGTGQCWHWANYVDHHDLWWHFARFRRAVEGIDPAAQRLRPVRIDHPRLRVYVLRGQTRSLVWCRDRRNTWRTELAEGRAPDWIRDATIDLAVVAPRFEAVLAYDPWTDISHDADIEATTVRLPAFRRSIVLHLEHDVHED